MVMVVFWSVDILQSYMNKGTVEGETLTVEWDEGSFISSQ
jgi:hypothetical protein